MTLFTIPCVGKYIDLFNDKDLSGWDGDLGLWKVDNGAITGYVEEGANIENHSYLIWQGGKVRNFELSLKFRSDSGNSGIDYRAKKLLKDKNGKDLKWTLEGYQADIVQNWMGSFYNWRLAGAQPGQFAIVTTAPGGSDEQSTSVFQLAYPNIVLGAHYYEPDRWNDYTVTVRGEHMIHRINGFQTIELIDLSSLKRSEGYLGFQVHKGNKKQVHKFKDIRLEQFDHDFGKPVLLFKDPHADVIDILDVTSAATKSDLELKVRTPAGSIVETTEQFADFILRFQFRRDADRLGVSLRMSEDLGIALTGTKHHFDRVSRKSNFGLKVVGIDRTGNKETSAFNPSWDDCEISLIDGELKIKVNGRLRAKAVNCDHVRGTMGSASNSVDNLRNVVSIPVIK